MERTGQETRGHDWAFMMGAGRCSSVVSPVIIWSARRTGTAAGISWTSKQRVSLRLGNVQSSRIPIFIPIFGKKWLVFIHAAAHRLLREKKSCEAPHWAVFSLHLLFLHPHPSSTRGGGTTSRWLDICLLESSRSATLHRSVSETVEADSRAFSELENLRS
jgi:hypothetical protein